MKSFTNDKLRSFKLANGLVALLSDVERKHGEEIALGTAEPALLKTLRRQSIITSSVASNAIENVIISPERQVAVLEEDEPAQTRDETEVRNYRRALDFLYTASNDELAITPELIQRLHAFVKDGDAEAGEYKAVDNLITEEIGGRRRMRFRPLSHDLVPDAMEQFQLGSSRVCHRMSPLS
jgi:hypothetical protein